MGLFSLFDRSQEFSVFWDGWSRGAREQAVYGLTGSQKAFLLGALAERTGRPFLLVTQSTQQVKAWQEDLAFLLPDQEVLAFPPSEILPYEVLAASPEIAGQRLQVLMKLANREPVTVVTTMDALLKKVAPPAALAPYSQVLRVGDRIDLEKLLEQLVLGGYERVPLVDGPGQFSLRGGILDVFPLIHPQPLRLEFFDDELDSIRPFDPADQRSTDKWQEAVLGPAQEFVLTAEARERGQAALRKEMEKARGRLLKLKKEEGAARLQAMVEGILEKLGEGMVPEGLDRFQNLFYPDQGTLFDFLHPEAVVVFDEPARLREAAEAKEQEMAETLGHLLADGSGLPSQGEVYGRLADVYEGARPYPILHLALLPKKTPGVHPDHLAHFTAKAMHPYLGKLEMLAEDLKSWRKQNYAVLLLAATDARKERIRDFLWDYGVEVRMASNREEGLVAGTVSVMTGRLESGFEFKDAKLVVVTDFEIFGREKKAKKPPRAFQHGAKIDTFLDLDLGDYVVHVNHGIGRYGGIEKLLVGGVQKDYLVLKYAGEDRLYVPTEQVHLIQKYVGAEGVPPKLYRLGGNDWNRVKTKVKESVRELAGDLLKLYAEREAREGFAFSPDTVWQKEFEDTFPYEETPDQLRSIQEVKKDMESKRPMDRLLCGDVGYGKTEVAIRAAFKAVSDGKQVAILVPTTILAQQHYNTFRTRFSGYPIVVDVLSRFRSAKEQKGTLEALAKGEVDVIIGTHRLVSSDVKFKDLGLLIIDEEQRFGVAQKEKLKHLKTTVDVLTLSATPIPRTLNMALVGLRDMSVIETPPEDRYPVQTYVLEYHPEVVREAIQRELNRGGQVFYVRNRIEDLERIERELRALVPEARIAVGHGKMREDRLERLMFDFLQGEYDVLLSTTIIETGLDIPNVNTLIVDGADLMGLSQLYQLRGRVGRSNRVAYAYFTYRKDKILTEAAEKRLHAIREFTELGSGFKIAMRDLEIRGVGNLLGPEQHGQMASVGFDLYCRLLEEAVRDLKGTAKEEAPETFVELRVDAYIPDSYIPDSGSKVSFYKRLSDMKTLEEVMNLEDELVDRFGAPPEPVDNLIRLGRIKALGGHHHVSLVQQEKDGVRIRFFPYHKVGPEAIGPLIQKHGRKLTFSAVETLEIQLKTPNRKGRDILLAVEEILQTIHKSQGNDPVAVTHDIVAEGASLV